MSGWLTTADQILRPGTSKPVPIADRARNRAAWGLFIGFGLLYGAVMGCFDGGSGIRPLQAVYSACKVPFLLGVTFGISWPSFFVLNTLAGVRRDIRQVWRALLTTQAGITLILASLAPYTALWYATDRDYNAAKLFNLATFGLSSVAGQAMLRREYRSLLRRSPAHRWLMWAWLGIYAFVGIQMAWVCRPFIGAPGMETRLFREGAWSNAYVHLVQVVWQVLSD